jgi:hypothetical protein
MHRPIGITVLGGLVGLAALLTFLISLASFIVGLAFLLPFPSQGVPILLNGFLFLGIAIVLAIGSFGLLQMRIWGWGLAILASLAALVYVAYSAFVGPKPEFTLPAAIILVLVGATLGYLLSVGRSFRRARPTM